MGGITGSIGLIYAAAGGGGGGAPSTEALQKSKRDNRIVNTNIPSGALAVYVENIDVAGDITINGLAVPPGGIWSAEALHNPATNKMELVTTVDIISGGTEYSFKVDYPSTSPVNINAI
ncbi:MAG: hypothetical protein GXO85_02235 [Chlorobi bacterium]|nr:hypothetical protein [Chlorobiota bacterium]